MRRTANPITLRSILAYVAITFSTAALLAGSGSARAADVAKSPAAANPAGADAMLKQIEAMKRPEFDASKKSDDAYRQQYMAQVRKLMADKADLQGKFATTYPDNPQAGKMRQERWMTIAQLGQVEKAGDEANDLLKQPGHANDADALYMLAQLSVMKNRGTPAAAQDAIDRFIQAAPKDERGAQLLYMTVRGQTEDEHGKAVAKRIVADYPDSGIAKQIQGQLRRTEAIGKPFELSFTEAVSGKPISMSDLKGKVVVVDFWATWCGPCVGEMPTMKKLYAEYKPKGVEFIGVSLDQPEKDGGLKDLKEFVAKEGITWPQYYQGNFWRSDFSMSWGVNSIPCVFVVDADGNLANTEARGKLEELIPELLKKRDAGKVSDASR